MNRRDIAAIMEREPMLTFAGMGLGESRRGLTKDQIQAKMQESRAKLLDSQTVCTRICDWLCKIRPIKSLNRQHSSYGLKHIVERELGEYVSNGQFIAAAIHSGFKFGARESLNVHFAMSERSIKAHSPKTPWGQR